MKTHWLFALTLVFLALMIGAERFSAAQARRAAVRQQTLNRQLSDGEIRVTNASRERAQYDTAATYAARIRHAVTWQADPTELLRGFNEVAAAANVRLTSGKMMPPEANSAMTVGGAYERRRVELRLNGSCRGLVEFVERVERGPHPAIVESLMLDADRETPGAGRLTLVVSCLNPIALVAGAPAAEAQR